MATMAMLSGKPGTGKSLSAKPYADKYPTSMFIIDSDGKGLAWAGWRKQFSLEKKNYIALDHPTRIKKAIVKISETRPDIKVVLLDTINSAMNRKEREDIDSKGYDKWNDYAVVAYDLYQLSSQLREDLIIFVAAHIEPYEDANGEVSYRMQIGGKKLKTRWNLHGKVNYNFYTHVEDKGDGEFKYHFLTQTDGKNEARSTYGVFDEYKIPNDLSYVVENIWTKDLDRNLDELKFSENA